MFLPEKRNPYLDMPARPTAGVSSGFGENIGAGYAGAAYLRSGYGRGGVFSEVYNNYLSSLESDYAADHGKDFDRPSIFSSFLDNAFLYSDIMDRNTGIDRGAKSNAELDFDKRDLELREWLVKRGQQDRYKSTAQLVEEAKSLAGDIDREVGQISARAGLVGSTGQLIGGIPGSFTFNDPLNVATLPVGGIGKTLAMRVATEMAAQSAIESANVFGGAVDRTRYVLGLDPMTTGEKIADVLTTGIGAGVLRGGAEFVPPVVAGAYRKIEEKLVPHLATERKIRDYVLDRVGGELPLKPSDMTKEDYLKKIMELNTNNAEFRALDRMWMLSDAEKDVFRVPQLSKAVRDFEIDFEGLKSSTAMDKLYTGRINIGDGETVSIDALIPDVSKAFEPEARKLDPELFKQLDEQRYRVDFLEKQLNAIDDRIGKIGIIDGIDAIDPVTGQLVRSIEEELNTVIPKARRVELENKLDQIVANLSEEEIARAHQAAVDRARADKNFGEYKKPRKEIEKELADEKRRFEKTSVKATKAIDSVLNQRKGIGDVINTDILAPLRAPPPDIGSLGDNLWGKVVSKPSERVSVKPKDGVSKTAAKVEGEWIEAKAAATDDNVTIGDMDIPRDFEIPQKAYVSSGGHAVETKTVQQIIDEIAEDDEMLNIMKVCEL